jgi:broad specificity phosphatase PhoE
MAKLILVKHAPPQIVPQVVSHRWVLAEEGCRRCDWLADELRAQGVTRLYSSLEPKALETAALVAVQIGLAVEPCRDLHENDRTGLDFIGSDELRRRLREFFTQSDRIVIGNETANGALGRFAQSIRNIAAKADGKASAIVAHGTVLSLFVAHHNTIPPYDLWSSLGLPSYVVLDTTSFAFDGEIHNYPDRPPAC